MEKIYLIKWIFTRCEFTTENETINSIKGEQSMLLATSIVIAY